MKKLFLFLLIVILSFEGCKKDEEVPKKPNTYSVKNASHYNFNDVSSYYWDGKNKLEIIKHGDIARENESSIHETSRRAITLSFKYSSVLFITTYPYKIVENRNNILVISDTTTVYSDDKKSYAKKLKEYLK